MTLRSRLDRIEKRIPSPPSAEWYDPTELDEWDLRYPGERERFLREMPGKPDQFAIWQRAGGLIREYRNIGIPLEHTTLAGISNVEADFLASLDPHPERAKAAVPMSG